MEDQELQGHIKKIATMQSKLSMDAWACLYNESKKKHRAKYYTAEEHEFIAGMSLATQKQYDNIDEFIADLLADPAALPLAQASMGDLIEKWANK